MDVETRTFFQIPEEKVGSGFETFLKNEGSLRMENDEILRLQESYKEEMMENDDGSGKRLFFLKKNLIREKM